MTVLITDDRRYVVDQTAAQHQIEGKKAVALRTEFLPGTFDEEYAVVLLD